MKIITVHRNNPALSMSDILKIEARERQIAKIIEAAELLYAAGAVKLRGKFRKPRATGKPRFNASRAVANQIRAAETRVRKLPGFIAALVVGGEPYTSDPGSIDPERWAEKLQQTYGPQFRCDVYRRKVRVYRIDGGEVASPVEPTAPADDLDAIRAAIRADAADLALDSVAAVD